MFHAPETKAVNNLIVTANISPGKSKLASKSRQAKSSAKISRKTRDALKHLKPLPVEGADSRLIHIYNEFMLAWQKYLIDAETNREADVTLADAIACTIVQMPAYTPEGMLLKLNAAVSVVGETKTEFPWRGKDFQFDTSKYSATGQIEYTLISNIRDDIRRLASGATGADPGGIATVASPLNEDTTLDRIRRHEILGKQMVALSTAADEITVAGEHVHGKEYKYIDWRGYSAIGGDEIERARDEFLESGIPAKTVEKEYQDAKRRYKEQKSKCMQWEKAIGIYAINQQIEAAVNERKEILQSFIATPPTTQKAASRLILYILDVYDGSEFDQRATDCLKATALSLLPIEEPRTAP